LAKKPLIKTPTDVPHQAKPFQEETHAEKRARVDRHLLMQTFEAAWHPGSDGIEDAEARIKSGLALVEGIKPTDDIESMLATQMAAAHNAAMECQRRAAQPGQPMEAFDLYMNNAAKLMLIYTRQMDALGKHRSKGHQKITVEHKNVDDRRQAVMGHAETAVALPEPSDQSETTPNHITRSAGKVIEMAGRTSAKRRSK